MYVGRNRLHRLVNWSASLPRLNSSDIPLYLHYLHMNLLPIHLVYLCRHRSVYYCYYFSSSSILLYFFLSLLCLKLLRLFLSIGITNSSSSTLDSSILPHGYQASVLADIYITSLLTHYLFPTCCCSTWIYLWKPSTFSDCPTSITCSDNGSSRGDEAH